MRELLLGEEDADLSPLVACALVLLAAMMATGFLFAVLITTFQG